jgi:SM-20-related protein
VTTSERQSADETAAQRRGTSARRDNVWCRIENFLPAAEHEQLLGAALACEEQFTASTTTSGDTGHRRSRQIEELPSPHRDAFLDAIDLAWPSAARSLGVPRFRASRVVAQLTTHGDGDYYRMHDDNGAPSIARRAITFVYYVHREPRPFAGGELALAGRDDEVAAVVAPLGNSVVFFASGRRHEVRQVRNDGTFANGRFTVNGWLYR